MLCPPGGAVDRSIDRFAFTRFGSVVFQELGQEAVSGVDLLCRTSAEFLKELAETDIGGGGGRVLASFVRGVYRAPGGR